MNIIEKKYSKKKLLAFTLIPPLFLVFSFIIIPITVQPDPIIGTFGVDFRPFQIHATWSSENASETITITWRSMTSKYSIIYYDTVPREGTGVPYAFNKRGEPFKYSDIPGYIHNVFLTNLTPNTTYYFICGAQSEYEGGVWSHYEYLSNEYSFLTPSLIPNEIGFVMGGDSRSGQDVRDLISSLMATYDPEFVLFSGDAVYDGNDQLLWDSWFNSMQYNWKTNNNRIFPIIPILANHEKNAGNYFAQYALPNNEHWFSIDYSKFVHIICLDSTIAIDGEQLIWLENDLKQYNDTLWKFVLFHEPPYSTGSHEPRVDIQELWCPLFDEYNVSIVFNGHQHLYERTKPIRNNSTTNSYLNGTMYVTSGGWGAPLQEGYYEWWTAYTETSHHFCVINISTNIDNSTLVLKQIRLNNTIGDSISIVKNLTLTQKDLFL